MQRILSKGVAVLASVGVVSIVALATHYLPAAWDGVRAPAAVSEAVAAALPGALPLAPEYAGAAPALRTEVLVGARAYAHNDMPVLADGSRFRLRLTSPVDAEVRISAVNPDGRSSADALWHGKLSAALPALTPMLRLTGARGMETLRIHVRAGLHGPEQLVNVYLQHD